MHERGYTTVWRLSGRKVVVVGGGPVAEGKVEGLLDTGADLGVVSPDLTPRLEDLHATGAFTWRRRTFEPADLDGAVLVFAATGDVETNRLVYGHAKERGVVVNAVDDPDRCDVTIPAVVRRGPVTVAVTTDGLLPAGARFLREELDRLLPPEIGDLVETGAEIRRALREEGRYRYDYREWREGFFEPGLAALAAEGPAGLARVAASFDESFAAGTASRVGSLTLVGAGPGDPGLITVAGVEALRRADVILYDRLVDRRLLDHAPAAAVRIPVGKEPGGGRDQDEINRTIIEHASAGSRVVRLKGGDPFIFGRGAEEIGEVASAGIPVTVIPGVTSVTAAPEAAGISLTRRGLSSSFAVVTGHRAGGQEHDWAALSAAVDTIVILMGVATAAETAARLVAAGRPADEPVAVVSEATTDRQQVARLTLDEMASRGSPLPSPAVIVVGPVAAQGA